MAEFAYSLLVIASILTSGLLVYSGRMHAVKAGAFRSVVTNQGVIRYRYITALTNAFTALQICVGVFGMVAAVLIMWRITILGGALIAVSGIYLVMALYLGRVVRLRTGAACGCFGGESAANSWTIVRVSVLGVPTLILAFVTTPAMPMMLLVLAGVACAALLGATFVAEGHKETSGRLPEPDRLVHGSIAR